MLAATQRLNLWGLLYLMLVGWLRFAVPRGMSSDARADAGAGRASWLREASWLCVRVLLGTSVALQYLATLSLPPTVLPAPGRRPWADWGESWLDSTGRHPEPEPEPEPEPDPNPDPDPNPTPNL